VESESRQRMIAEERRHRPRWHFLSFADSTRFRGGAIVRAHGFLTAVERATDLGINPGGEVLCSPIRRKDLWRVPPELRNRLLSEEEVLTRLDGRSIASQPGTVTVYTSSAGR
jgi:hypothetical protein